MVCVCVCVCVRVRVCVCKREMLFVSIIIEELDEFSRVRLYVFT